MTRSKDDSTLSCFAGSATGSALVLKSQRSVLLQIRALAFYQIINRLAYFRSSNSLKLYQSPSLKGIQQQAGADNS